MKKFIKVHNSAQQLLLALLVLVTAVLGIGCRKNLATQASRPDPSDTKQLVIGPYLSAYANNPDSALAAALKELFSGDSSSTLDLEGRTITLNGPVDVAQAAAKTSSSVFCRITNGILTISQDVPNQSVTKQGQLQALALTMTLSSTQGIVRGMHISGPGLSRETYVTEVINGTDIGINTYAISAQTNQQYTFTKFGYLLDFSGFNQLSRLSIDHVNFSLRGMVSGIMMGSDGIANHIESNWILDPKNRGITDFNSGARGISINNNEMVSNATAYADSLRYPVAITISNNDPKIRSNRIAMFRHAMIIHGGGALITGNHWWQGVENARTAGLIFTGRRVKGLVDGNYVDNNWIELSNESAAANTTPIGRISIVGNHFTNAWQGDSAAQFSWIRIAPYTVDAPVAGILVTGNTFISLQATVLRSESVDATNGSVNLTNFEDVYFSDNTWEKVTYRTYNPLTVQRVIPPGQEITNVVFQTEKAVPFGAQINAVTSVGLNNMRNPDGTEAYLPYNSYPGSMLSNKSRMQVRFPTPCSGTITVTGTVNVLP